MSDINEIKSRLQLGNYSYKKRGDEFSAPANETISSLITTIESLEINKEQDATQYANLRSLYYETEREIEQKDALIESQKEEIKNVSLDYCGAIDVLEAKIESLKAITELAVNAMKQISNEHYGSANTYTWQQLTKSTLSEIERLQNAQT